MDLKKHLNDEGMFKNVSSEIFSKTENNKNKIDEKQQNFFRNEKLINARDSYIVGVTKAGSSPRTDSEEVKPCQGKKKETQRRNKRQRSYGLKVKTNPGKMDAQGLKRQKKQTGPNKTSTGSAFSLENGSKQDIPGQPEQNSNLYRSHKNGESGTEEHKQTPNTEHNHSAADCLPS